MKRSRIGTGFIALAAASALALTGCSSSGSGGSSDGGDSSAIVTAWGSEPQNPLLPANTNEVGGGKITDSIYAGLVYYDGEGAAHNDIAESIETDDAKTYTIKLREDAKFTDGTPVQAHNFVDAWNFGAALDNQQLNSYFFEDIEGFSYDENVDELPGLKVTGDYEFTVTLNKAASDFPLRLGYTAYYPLPDVAFEDIEAFGQNPVGNGPYKLASDDAWEHDVKIDLVKNEDYNGPREPKNDGLTITFYASLDSAYSDLLGGNLDVLDALPDAALETYEDDLGDRAINQPAAINQTITIPARLEHFDGEEGQLRRQALSMAIDRAQITDVIFKGTRTTAQDFTSPVIDGWSDSIPGNEVLEFNPDEAKKLWAEADAIAPWSGTFEIAYNADAAHQGWVDAVSNSIKNTLGIDAAGKPYPTFPEIREIVTNRTIDSAFRTGWQADYPGLFNFLGPLFATNAGSNDGDYSNPEFDKLMQSGSVQTDQEKANADFQKAQEILFKDLPAIPLWYQNVSGGFSENVDNVTFGWNSVPLYYEITKK
ncbi:peptide ABC transporter substrate-binding protein [Leucobacter sp. USHLN153]|uniref:peptide ABC transporter substrate-binding protein n=1 Tax=Leucobacter sp. USHLN153 TaxID=3081268 RepID=UPI003018C010